MATKTISLTLDAYERLRRAKESPGESFSEVVMRGKWNDLPVTGAELLSRVLERGPTCDPEQLDGLDRMKTTDVPPEDKWKAD